MSASLPTMLEIWPSETSRPYASNAADVIQGRWFSAHAKNMP